MPMTLDGVMPSGEVLDRLYLHARPVLLSFSTGKDSTAAWIAMLDRGIEVVPVYFYGIPGLEFVEDALGYYEDYFETRIHRYPSPALFRQINGLVFQPPQRCAVVEAAHLRNLNAEQIWAMVRADLWLPGSWVADGVRASDSLVRRTNFVRNGAMRESVLRASPVWDWLVDEVRGLLAECEIELPADYGMFGMSFDGIDARFTRAIRDRYPRDYERILEWYPYAGLDIERHDAYGIRVRHKGRPKSKG